MDVTCVYMAKIVLLQDSVDLLSGAVRHLFQVTDVHDAVARTPVGTEFECINFGSHFGEAFRELAVLILNKKY